MVNLGMAISLRSTPSAEIQIDRLGRVVIPNQVRKILNLLPGTRLVLHLETDDSIVLKVIEEEPATHRKDGVMVIEGELVGQLGQDQVAVDRNERIKKLIS